MGRLVRPRVRGALVVLIGVSALAACGGGGDGGGGGESVTVTTGAGGGPARVSVAAHDVYFDVERITTPAGELEVTLRDEGNQAHTFVVDGVDGFKLEVSGGSSEDRGVVELEAGEYEYYCDVPGHRGQGMAGTLVVQ